MSRLTRNRDRKAHNDEGEDEQAIDEAAKLDALIQAEVAKFEKSMGAAWVEVPRVVSVFSNGPA